MTDELSGPAGEALRILAMHPELGTPEAINTSRLWRARRSSRDRIVGSVLEPCESVP